MAVTTLTIQDISRSTAPSSLTYGSANADGSYFANNGNVFLHARNASAGAIVVTFTVTGAIGGLTPANITVTVPLTSGDKMIGPFPPEVFNDAQGRVLVTYASVTSLTVAAVRLP